MFQNIVLTVKISVFVALQNDNSHPNCPLRQVSVSRAGIANAKGRCTAMMVKVDLRRDLPLPLRLAGRLLPGIARVHAQAAAFGDAWQRSNEEARAANGPVWVALGDSMSQGIGARSIEGGWVGQLRSRLMAQGVPVRLINLSATGARVKDVVQFQLPELAALGQPAVVTVLVGANDMFPPARRTGALSPYSELLSALPGGRSVVGTLPRRNRSALAINALVDAAAARGEVRIADMRGMTVRSLWGTRAEDLFHPDESGYAWIARRFAPAVEATLGQSDAPQ